MQSVFDRRRINGPEDSSAPIFADEHQKSLTPDLYKDRHNRSVSDIRPICLFFLMNSRDHTCSYQLPPVLQPGLISQANGSAYIETDRTKIACSVSVLYSFQNTDFWLKGATSYGPRQSKNTAYNEKGRLNVEVKFTPFSSERRRAPLRVCKIGPTTKSYSLYLLGCRRSVNRGCYSTGPLVLCSTRAFPKIHNRYFLGYNRSRWNRGMCCFRFDCC